MLNGCRFAVKGGEINKTRQKAQVEPEELVNKRLPTVAEAYPSIWRTINIPGKPPERKGRVLIDIRGLNKISMFDAYPVTLQTDIISAVLGCPKPQEGQRCLHKTTVEKSIVLQDA